VLAGVSLALGGCAFEEHREELARMHAAGRYDEAAKRLDDPKVRRLYDREDEVLWHMDRGAVALGLGDTGAALTQLEEAKRQTEFSDTKDAGEVIAEWVLNDNFRRYIAEPYEDMYLSVLTMVALLEEGRVDPGAANEARAFGTRTNVLRDRYNQQVKALGAKDPRLAQAGWRASETGAFVESPLGAYLASLSFMAAGQRDAQKIAADHMVDAIRQQQDKVGPVRAEDFLSLADKSREDTNTVVVAFAGRGPTKRASRLPPIVIDKVTFYAEIPVLVSSVSRVASAEAEFEGGPTVPLSLAEDMAAVAKENYDRTMPLIQGRAIARAAARAVGAYFITETVDKSTRRKSDVARWGTELALLAAQILVERADVRAWAFMPGRAFVATAKLPAGDHRYRVVYKGAGGGVVYTSPWKVVKVSEGTPLVAAVAHYWD
jgi:hypothetical protein